MTSDVVALDPEGLAALEATLRGVADVLRSQAGQVLDVLGAVGESGMAEAAELHRLAGWCSRQGEDVARRRLVLAALPVALPRPTLHFADRAVAWSTAEALAPRLRRVLDGPVVPWPALAALVAEVGRGVHDEAFAARLLTLLGPERTAELPWVLARSARDAGVGAEADVAQEVVAATLLRASRRTGPGRLSPAWIAGFTGVPSGPSGPVAPADPGTRPAPRSPNGTEALLGHLGFGTDLARAVAIGLGARRLGLALRVPGTVLAVAGLGRGGGGPWDVAAGVADTGGTLGLLLVTSGVVSTPLGVAAALAGGVVASALGWLLHQVVPPPADRAAPEARRRRSAPAFDPATGTTRYPGGGPDRPHQDGAGGVHPPSMVR